jgi:hypothetical protein
MKFFFIITSLIVVAFSARADDKDAVGMVWAQWLEDNSKLQYNLTAFENDPVKQQESKEFFVGWLSSVDVSNCPDEFKKAWKTHLHALADFIHHDTLTANIFALGGIIHGSVSGAEKISNYEADYKTAFIELKSEFSQYGFSQQ